MKILRNIIIIYIVIFVPGCEKEQVNRLPDGKLVGFIELVDESGRYLEDKSGVTVNIDGINYSVTTNKTGRYEFDNLPAGTYNLNFNKNGFGTYKLFGYQFIGGSVPALLYKRALFAPPSIEVNNLRISYNANNGNLSIDGNMTKSIQYDIQVFINDSSTLTNRNHDFASNIRGYCCYPTTTFYTSINIDDAYYAKGKTIYLAIYFINSYDDSRYFDHDYDLYVYPSAIKASEIITYEFE